MLPIICHPLRQAYISIYNLSNNYTNQITVKENYFPKPRLGILFNVLIAMTILLLDFVMVSLQLDIHMESYSALKMSNFLKYLFTISKNKHNTMTRTVRGNAALWLAHFMTFAMFISDTTGNKPRERQRNSVLLFTKLLVFSAAPKWNLTKWIWKYSFQP